MRMRKNCHFRPKLPFIRRLARKRYEIGMWLLRMVHTCRQCDICRRYKKRPRYLSPTFCWNVDTMYIRSGRGMIVFFTKFQGKPLIEELNEGVGKFFDGWPIIGSIIRVNHAHPSNAPARLGLIDRSPTKVSVAGKVTDIVADKCRHVWTAG